MTMVIDQARRKGEADEGRLGARRVKGHIPSRDVIDHVMSRTMNFDAID
jgi:hypothetical protein